MKKKILAFVLAFMFVLPCAFLLSGCGKKDVWEPPHNVVQNLPTKLHVEYGSTVFVKDGNEYYCVASNKHRSNRTQVYMKLGLTHEVCVAQGYGGWLFISAYYNDYTENWVLATEDDECTLNEPYWHANDFNQNTYTNAEVNTRHGYGDVNPVLDSTVATQLADETITLASGQHVECVVWQSVFEYNGTYSKSKYWYAKDTGVYLKGLTVYNKTDDIDTDGSSYGHPVATYYAVDESMTDYLTSIGKVAPDMSAFN